MKEALFGVSREGLFFLYLEGGCSLSGLLERVPFDRVVVAIDPGKAVNRVWVTTGDGVVGEPLSLPTSRDGLDRLGVLVEGRQARVFAIEATGSLHRAWAAELERRWPGSPPRCDSDAARASSDRARTSCLCTGCNGSGRVGLPLVVLGRRAHVDHGHARNAGNGPAAKPLSRSGKPESRAAPRG